MESRSVVRSSTKWLASRMLVWVCKLLNFKGRQHRQRRTRNALNVLCVNLLAYRTVCTLRKIRKHLFWACGEGGGEGCRPDSTRGEMLRKVVQDSTKKSLYLRRAYIAVLIFAWGKRKKILPVGDLILLIILIIMWFKNLLFLFFAVIFQVSDVK